MANITFLWLKIRVSHPHIKGMVNKRRQCFRPILLLINPARVGFFYEFDWLKWMRLWALSQAETIITGNFFHFRKTNHFLKLEMKFCSLRISFNDKNCHFLKLTNVNTVVIHSRAKFKTVLVRKQEKNSTTLWQNFNVVVFPSNFWFQKFKIF